MTAATYGLHRVGLGYPDSTKDAVVWGSIAGLVILFKFNDAGEAPRLLRYTLGGAFGATALVEFFANLYVFPLFVQLFFQPFVAVVKWSSVIAARDEKTQAGVKQGGWCRS